MAQSLAAIALQFTQPPQNQAPVWVPSPTLAFVEGTPFVHLLSSFVFDPDGDPLDIGFSNVLASLAGMGIEILDLGADVEVRYDGRAVGATPTVPVDVPNAFIGSADDGKAQAI